jgi:hypothetical protein
MTTDQRTELLDVYYSAIREKKLEDPDRFMNMSEYNIMREILNVDMPRALQEAIEEGDRHNNYCWLINFVDFALASTVLKYRHSP